MKSKIKSILRQHAKDKVNLHSESAREVVATDIIEVIEKQLRDAKTKQRKLMRNDELDLEESDIDYLSGKREGFEEALMLLLDADSVEEIYDDET